MCVFQGYWGCAIGKAKQAAKTEIEKLQVSLNLHIIRAAGDQFLNESVHQPAAGFIMNELSLKHLEILV